MSQSSNDSFPSAMDIAAAVEQTSGYPGGQPRCATPSRRRREWKDIVKIGRTHMQDATPITLGQEWSGYAAC